MLSTNQPLQKGRYRVIQQFTTDSQDGMYEAYDAISDSNVVLKEYVGTPAKVITHSQREASDAAFFGGAKTLSSFKHTSLVSVHDYFSEIGCQYLVLEAFEGFDFTRYLEPGTERPQIDEVLKWVDQLLNALHFLHRHSPPVIHGNIRPENIWFTSGGDAKLFAADLNSTTSAARDFQKGGFDYQPFEKVWPSLDPSEQQSFLKDYDERSERLLRGPADARSDLYSIGACIYHVLTGVKPPDALERATAFRDKKPDPLQKLCDLEKNIPVEVSEATMKALEIKRELRFYSAVVMAQVLRTAIVKVVERSGEGDSDVASGVVVPLPPTTESAENKTDSFVDSIPDFAPTGADARQRQLEEEQLELEAEHKKIEERRQAIEVERSRLKREAELESQKAEQERRAEEKRLLESKAEEERSQAAKRLAEIEEETRKRLAEAERQRREAEADRQRAEKRLADLHAERERQLDEEQRAAAAVREELECAERRLLELSHLDSPVLISADPLEDDLLELNTPTTTPSVELTVPKALKDLAVNRAESVNPTNQKDEPDFGFREPARTSKFGWKLPVIGAIVALLVAVVFGWMFLRANVLAPLPEMEVQTMVPPIEADPSPADNLMSIEQSVDVPEPSPAETQQAETPSAVPEPATVSSQKQNIRPTETTKANEKPKKLAQATINKPEPKKVTVDDLINDN